MECFVLGSGGMMPMPRRRLTSVAVRTGGWVYLLDCGEGTQVPYKELHLGQRPLRVIAVTHLHADHCLGLPGLLMLRAQLPDPGPLDVLGPPGLGRFLRHVRQDLGMYINYEVRVREWSATAGTVAYADEVVRLSWRPLAHSVLCLGYRLEEHERPGRFDPAAAAARGIPFGPLRGQLQRGETVILPDGSRVAPAEVVGPPRRGRRVGFVTDTAPCAAISELLADTDVAFVEAMFLAEHVEDGREKKHLTAEQAAQAARQAAAQRLVLVHISPRYEASEVRRLAEEAAQYHPAVHLAQDGESFAVPLPD